MTYRVVYAPEAVRRIAKLDAPVKERVREAIERLRLHPEIGKRLTGLLSDRWSYRVGSWRILYRIHRGELIVLILTVGHRRDVYR